MSKKREKIIKNKQKALNYFKKRVLANNENNDIARIYLFGSLAKEKNIRSNSDKEGKTLYSAI